MVVKSIKLFLEYSKINLATSMEYKANFLIQSSFMFLNDIVWLIIWFLFYQRFVSVKGWYFDDFLYLVAFVVIIYGMAGVFFGNFERLGEIIVNGKLDFYLSVPEKPIIHLLVSRSDFTGWGDIVFGIIILLMILPLTPLNILLVILFLGLGVITLISFGILVGSLAFFIGGAESLTHHAMMGLISLAHYPASIFGNVIKVLLLTLVPAMIITGIPVMLLRKFNLSLLIYLILLVFGISLFSYGVFKVGLRKYESGNLINVRV